MTSNMEQEKEYYAFISYKREDEKWAKWLQNKLEHYKLPSNVRKGNGELPKNLEGSGDGSLIRFRAIEQQSQMALK